MQRREKRSLQWKMSPAQCEAGRHLVTEPLSLAPRWGPRCVSTRAIIKQHEATQQPLERRHPNAQRERTLHAACTPLYCLHNPIFGSELCLKGTNCGLYKTYSIGDFRVKKMYGDHVHILLYFNLYRIAQTHSSTHRLNFTLTLFYTSYKLGTFYPVCCTVYHNVS